MKNNVLLFIGFLILSLGIQAQTPEKFNYQGIARDNAGVPMTNQLLGIKISLIDGQTTVYSETHHLTTNDFGLYTLAIGDGTPVSGAMGNIDWSSGNKFINVAIDPLGGTHYSSIGTTELLSVPYALYAESSGSGGGGGSPTGPAGGDLTGTYPDPEIADGAVTSEKLNQMGASNDQVLTWNGTNWSPEDIDVTGDDWGAQVVISDATLEGDGTTDEPLGIADNAVTTVKVANNAITTAKIANAAVTSDKLNQMGAANDQVLKWNGTHWIPADEITGDDWGTQVAETNATIDGDGTTTDPLGLADNAVTTGKIAHAAVTSDKLNQMGAANDQVLKWNGTHWIPADEITGDDWGTQVAETNATIDGDGTTTDPLGLADNAVTTVKIADAAVTGEKLNQMGAANDQVLKWNGTNWIPADETNDAFFTVDGNQIGYANTANFGKNLVVNTENINHTAGNESKMMFLPSREGAIRAGSIHNESWDVNNIGGGSVGMGRSTKALGGYSISLGGYTEALSNYSVAMGWGTQASELAATALGRHTTASGPSSTAMGSNTKAFGESATAMGYYTVASGEYATAMGYYSKASGEYATAMGNNTEASGEYATTMGYYTGASGKYATAMGYLSKASGKYATAMGYNTNAPAEFATAIGFTTEATGYGATAMGHTTEASREYAIAMGFATEASGVVSTAMGSSTESSGLVSTAMGGQTHASGNYATAMGQLTEAAGNNSTAMGQNSKALAENSTVIGKNIRLTSAATGSMFLGDASRTENETQGKTGTNRFYATFDNGYVLHTNGTDNNFGVIMSHNSNSWSSISDRNKKENIKIADGKYFLESIKKMELGSWNYIGQEKEKYRHYGPMAQDFYKYFGHDGIGTIGTDTTIATADIDGVMMIAIQQLAKENDSLKDEIAALKDALDEKSHAIEAMVETYNQVTDQMEQRLTRMEAILQRTDREEVIYTKL